MLRLPSTDYKRHFHSQGKTQAPQKTRPVKAQSSVTEQMGSRGSKDKSTASSHHESTGSSSGRQPRTSERNSSVSSRSSSQQPEQRQYYSGNYSMFPSEMRISRPMPDYGNDSSRVAHNRSDYTSSSLTSDTTSQGNSKFGRTVFDSSVYHYGSGAGAATASPDAYYSKARTGRYGLSQSQGSSDADIAPIHKPTTTFNASSDSNSRSNGRQSRATDRSGSTRIRSASQGLRNLGNTCYMNSILQCLAKVPWFNDRHDERHLNFHDDLLNEFFSLMKKMQDNDSDDSSLNPYQFRQQISSLGFRFSSSDQNDAHEFLLCLLSRLSKTLKSEEKTSDLVADFLSGRQQNVIRFKGCGHILINEQPFFSLSLPLTLESGKSMFRSARVELRRCLENYTRIEDVDGDALCMNCQLMQLCSIEASFKHLPKILIIHLKRYDFMRAEKLENEVSFPLEKLRITQKDLDPSGEVVDCCEEEIVYDLFAVCNHYGSLRFGHYTADIKSPSNNWYNYSDSRVTQTRMTSASQDACILFYRLQSRF